MTAPTPAAVLAALDFTPTCWAGDHRPATAAFVFAHADTWDPCDAWPVCAAHAAALTERLAETTAPTCPHHHEVVTWRRTDLVGR